MASKWSKFEIDAKNYLKQYYGTKATFELQGGSTSTKSDILVRTRSGNTFYIEVKSASAQGYQFVLHPDQEHRCFTYAGKLAESQYTQEIQEYMKSRFDEYSTVGTKGLKIDLPESVFYNHAIDYSHKKNVKYIITNHKKQFVIFPVDRISAYMSISGMYRPKKSGSRHPTNTNVDEIKSLFPNTDYTLNIGNSKTATFIDIGIDLNGEKLKGPINDYLFKAVGQSSYEITRLSNTNNRNVICKLRSKQVQDPNDLACFLNDLK